MDPLCHTLVGGSLAHAGLRRVTPLATATLLIGANLPDVDGLAYLVSQDLALGVRRGWTHGVLAAMAWPFVLAGVMLAVDRWRRRRRPDRRPAAPGRLLLVAAVAVASHPALDWLNAYGIRLLMPFSDRWFYGDAAFIVDPWMWVLPGAAVALATSHRFSSMAAWLVLGALTSAVVLLGPGSTTVVRVAWTVALGAIVAVRWLGATPLAKVRVARAGLVLLVVYVLALKVVSLDLARRAGAWLDHLGVDYRTVVALPLPGRPFTRDLVVVGAEEYRFLRGTWLDPEPAPVGRPAPTGGPTEITAAALGAPAVWGLATWIRLPSYEVERLGDGYRVRIRDVRFWRPGRPNGDLGEAVVELDRNLHPVDVHARTASLGPCLGPAVTGVGMILGR